MEINLTLFVQVIHFFIALYLLRVLYFKPALAVIDAQDEQEKKQLHEIRRWQAQISQKESDQRSIWQRLKTISSKKALEPFRPDFFIFKDIAPIFEPEPLDAEQVGQLVEQTKKMIIEDAEHVEL